MQPFAITTPTTADRDRPARRDAYDLDPAALAAVLADMGEPAYRARQVWRWLYRGLAPSFEAMTDLPRSTRARLAEALTIGALETVATTTSDDGLATKFLFQLSDGQLVETVLMHYVDPADDADDGGGEDGGSPAAAPRGRHTVCLSTQAGCAMGCVFCATGQMGLVRNLTRGEVVAQAVACARVLAASGERLDNVVFMGMGEPLANWDATWGAVEALVDPAGFGLSPRRLTISTVGIVPGMRRLAAQKLPVRLAVSIHAADDALRGALVAVNATYPLDEVLAACHEVQAAGLRRLTIEVVLIAGVNDRPEQAALLAQRLAGLRCHVNLIPLNPTPGSTLQPSRYDDATRFQAVLRRAGYPTTLRMRRGIEIAAGCGQLRSRAAEGRLGRTIPRPAGADAP